MTTLKGQAPPVNLKERIAALQQRSVSPSPRATSPSPAPVTSPSSAGLRDKIARFEKKGGIPVPRGSFGLGAPPLAENGPAKRRGELYGNRIPGTVRASGGGPTTSRSASPFESSSRSFSLSALDTDELEASALDGPSSPTPLSPASPYLGSSVEHTTVPKAPAPRGTSFATALDLARKAESTGELRFGRQDIREMSASPPPPASCTPVLSLEPLIGDELGELELQESPPAIIISSDENPHTPDSETPDDDSSTAPLSTTSSDPGAHPLPNPPEEVEEALPDDDPSGHQTPVEVLTSVVAVTPEPAISPASDSIIVEEAPAVSVPTEDEDGLPSSDQASTSPHDTKKPLPQIPPPSPNAMSAAVSSEDLPTNIGPTEEVAVTEGVLAEVIEVSVPASEDSVSIVAAAIQDSENPADPLVVLPEEVEQPENDNTSQKKARPDEIEILSPDQIQSPAGPLTLADAVHALGQTVANIQGLFPDQISPLATPPAYRSLHIDSVTDDGIRSHRREESLSRDHRKKPSVDLTIKVESPPTVAPSLPPVETASKSDEPPQREVLLPAYNESSITITESIPQASDRPVTPKALPPTPNSEQHVFLTTPSAGGRPVSMIEMSPSHVVQAHRVTPLTSRGVPIFVPAVQGPQDFGHFPPTPDPEETDFGTVSVHKQSHSFSHARPYISHGQTDTKTASFKAVVHTKVTELPSSVSMPVIPQTPQMNRTKRSIYGDVPPSPGYGELAALLQEAALLEETLEKGELPDEAIRQEALEKKRLGEKVAAERAAAEERRRAQAAFKSLPREKRDEPETKSKSSFSTLLRGKSSSRKDALPNEAPTLSARDHARAKSVLYPHRSSQDSRQSPAVQHSMHAQTLETHDEAPPMDSDPHQTSPKSRQYFAGLRRLASTSRPSMASSTHPRHSASTSSEISSEDSVSVVTPPDGGLDSAGSGNGVSWPSLSPKKSPGGVSRAASFAGKMWQRGRTKSTMSTNSAYETIERITQSASKSATASIPPFEPMSFTLDVPMTMQTSPPSPIEELVSPRRSASFHVSSKPQFPPTYSPTPTSPVYTPFLASAPRFDDVFQPLQIDGLLPAPKEDIRPVSWMSEASTSSSIPSPLFDSFPAVPQDPPLHTTAGFSHGPGSARNAPRPSLPLSVPSFFDATPLSSTPVGSEFLSNSSPFLRSATTSTPRPVTMPPQSSAEQYR